MSAVETDSHVEAVKAASPPPPAPADVGSVTSSDDSAAAADGAGSEGAGSRPGSRQDAGSRSGSRADGAGSEGDGSRPGSRADGEGSEGVGSRPGSRVDTGSRPGSRADDGSRPGSRADSASRASATSEAADRERSASGDAAGDSPSADDDAAKNETSQDAESKDEASRDAEKDKDETSQDADTNDETSRDAEASRDTEKDETSRDAEKDETSRDGKPNDDASRDSERRASTDSDGDGKLVVMEEDDDDDGHQLSSAERDVLSIAEREAAEAMTVEKEEPGLADEGHQVTVIDVPDDAAAGQKGSPLKRVRVVATASVPNMDDSEAEDDPAPTNGDEEDAPLADRRRRSPRAVTTYSSSNRGSSAGGKTAQTNGRAAEPATASRADAAPPSKYGLVTPLYKESESPKPRPLLPATARPIGGGAPAENVGAGAASTRQSKCIACGWVKPVKYMMMANGASSGNCICSDECLEKCVNNVKSGRMSIGNDGSTLTLPPPPPVAPATSLTVANVTTLFLPNASAASVTAASAGTGTTSVASPAGGGVSSSVKGTPAAAGTTTTTGSRARTVCQNAACSRPINSKSRTLRTVWETMIFCSPSCAVEHQKKDGSSCVFCKTDLPEMIMGKYCVRFGSDVRQFCSNLCLDGFKKRLKVCSYCQRDITRFQGSFLAPVGNAGAHQFKEFCSQSCLTRYKTTHTESGKSQPATWANCAVCLKNTPVEHKVAVQPNEPVKQLCSQICLKAYKFAIKDEGQLTECVVCKTLLVMNNLAQFRVWNGLAVAHLCSQSCSNVYVLSNRRIVSCRYCRVKKYNFDMMEMTSEKDGLYCSVFCLKNCGKQIDVIARNVKSKCAHCSAEVDSSVFSRSVGGSAVFCSTKCSQAGVAEKGSTTGDPPASNGVAAPPAKLPQIQSVISLADDDTSRAGGTKTSGGTAASGGQAGSLVAPLSSVRDHPALVMMPPAPVFRRNVSVQVQPRKTGQEKAEEIKVTEKEKKPTATIATQTDDGAVRILPVPVPIYIPVPMMMYNCPVPVPLAMPMPVPVPLLCGAEDALRLLCGLPAVHGTKRRRTSGEESPRAITDRKRRRSSGSLSDSSAPGGGPEPLDSDDSDGGAGMASCGPGSPDSVGGSESADSAAAAGAGRPPPHKRRRVSGSPPPAAPAEPVDLAALLRAPVTRPRPADGAAPPPAAAEEGADSGDVLRGTEFTGPVDETLPCHKSAIKYTWCVRVYEQFVRERNGRPRPSAAGCDSDSAQSATDSDRLVADPLQATPSELAAGLSAMVRELRRPGGSPYPPDIIHYLLLGIQLYLLEHRRWDSLFWGESYTEMASALEERLRPVQEELMLAELDSHRHAPTTHVEERQLWEARVLGAHSPQSVLTTVIYFITKYFLIGSLEWHQKLSFAMIQESINLKSRLKQSSLKLLDSRNVYKRSKTFEMPANTEDPFRCPVRFVEFYLSRCPEPRPRTAPLYLTPAADGRPDGAAWFSAEPLSPGVLQQTLGRLLTVRELQEVLIGGEAGRA